MSTQIAPWLANSRWPTVPIRYVARLGTGHTPSRQRPEYWENCTVPWVTLADVWQLRSGTVDVIHETKEKISPLGIANSSAVRHPSGTVILSRTASVGFSAILGMDAATSQDFATWTCGDRLDNRYLLYALRAMAPDLRRVAAGSTHKTIYMPDIEQLRIPLPPIEEQHRVASYLDEITGHLNQVRVLRTKQMAALAEHETATISEALFPGILDRTINKSWRWPWLPATVKEHQLVRLGYVCRLQTGLTVDGARTVGQDSVTLPYLRVANVQAGWIDLGSVSEITVPRQLALRSALRTGDVLMTEGGDLDKLGRGTVWNGELPECLHQNHVFALRPLPEILEGDYLAFLTQSLHGRCYFESTGTKTTNLASTNSSKILGFPIPLPDLSKQKEIVVKLRSHIGDIERAQRTLERQVNLLAERQQALITAAVTGQIDVPTTRNMAWLPPPRTGSIREGFDSVLGAAKEDRYAARTPVETFGAATTSVLKAT